MAHPCNPSISKFILPLHFAFGLLGVFFLKIDPRELRAGKFKNHRHAVFFLSVLDRYSLPCIESKDQFHLYLAFTLFFSLSLSLSYSRFVATLIKFLIYLVSPVICLCQQLTFVDMVSN